MDDFSRRDFVRTAALTATGAVMSGFIPQAKAAEKEDRTLIGEMKVFGQECKPTPLPFNPSKLNGISEKLITSHWENNYMGSVKTLNAVDKKLHEALSNKDTPPFVYGDLKREHLMRTGSVVYHDYYFGNLGGNGKPSGAIQKKLSGEFGTFNNWETEFKKIGLALGGGSGWVVLGFNSHLNRIENYWVWDHLHGPAATMPLLVMDMYEHAYQMDYGAAAAKYVDAFFNNINWEEVEKRFEKTKKMSV